MLAAHLATPALLASAAATEIGESRTFGLGVQLGTPTGLTGKVYVNGRENAVDFLLGTYADDYGPLYDGFFAQGSYHWSVTTLTRGGGVEIPFRIGVGGFVGRYYYGWYNSADYNDFVVGARVPFGLDFDLESAPVQFYVEAAPQLTAIPLLFVGFDGGVGFRYYF